MQPTAAAAVFIDNDYDLVLGGGGIKGLGHVGVLQAAWERGIRFKDIYCVSIGSLVGTIYANGHPIPTLAETFMTELDKFGREAFSSLFTRQGLWNIIKFGGAVDVRPFFEDLIARHKLTPQPHLKLVAAHWTNASFHPHLFEGTNYELAAGMHASCAMPPFVMPVWVQCGEKRIRLVDGGLWHQAPHSFCQRQAIISRLGLAKKWPERKLNPTDMVIHAGEMVVAPMKELFGHQVPEHHITIHSGKDEVATFTFDLTDEVCKSMVKHGYDQASRSFDEMEREYRCRNGKG